MHLDVVKDLSKACIWTGKGRINQLWVIRQEDQLDNYDFCRFFAKFYWNAEKYSILETVILVEMK